MRRILIAVAFILSVAPVWAEPAQPEPREPEAPWFLNPELRDAIQDLSRSLLGFLRALPRYEAPRMDDNGDIIIPRAPDSRERFFGPRAPSAPSSTPRPIAV